MAFDGEPIDVPAHIGAALWESTAVLGLTVTRTAVSNGVRVQLNGPRSRTSISASSSSIDLTDGVHGVLGQNYRSDYVNKLAEHARGAPNYVSSYI
ncbi:putative root cap protein 1 [Panicum miliaceum]|uniref:Root cap protein 1 n=1 Tax=Panicum miliaceum TaxID=4540 RepID=A0A3L6SL02_PANMI|nr:putative root cap protein 1 [Panicum miliaceum]